MTLTSVAERLAVELSLPVFTIRTPNLRGERSNPLRHSCGYDDDDEEEEEEDEEEDDDDDDDDDNCTGYYIYV